MSNCRLTRVAFWGINDIILNVIRNEIDPRKAEIVAFLDSKTEKVGHTYMGIPVVSWTKEVARSVDHVIVSALSAYEDIKHRLAVDHGVPSARVHPFITPDLTEYCLGELTPDDFDIVRDIYFTPAPMIELMHQYEKIYSEYKAIPVAAENRICGITKVL